MAISADVFSGLLAFVFGNAALAKLLRQELQVQTAAKLQIHGLKSAICSPMPHFSAWRPGTPTCRWRS